MKKLILIITSIFFLMQGFTQNLGDTIVVQTFIHDAWTDGNGNSTVSLSSPRDTIGFFPNNPNLTFEKIIMAYNMRCKDNNNNNPGGTSRVGCGAYDYSCHTYVHDSTKVDSVLNFTTDHIISNFSGNTYNFSYSPVYNYNYYIQYNNLVDSIISEDTITIGLGSIVSDIVIKNNEVAGKSQFLYLSNELNTFLLNDTVINSLSIYCNNVSTVNFLKIKMKLTSDSALNPHSPHIEGFTEVYNSNTNFNVGLNRLHFYTPFVWDSTSNIIIEFSFTDSINSTAPQIFGDIAGDSIGVYSNDANYIQSFGSGNLNLPTSFGFPQINNEITISFWAYGDENTLPVNTSICEALDSAGSRTLNIHFPWNNGKIYWDCGNNGSSYDRIEKAANINEYAGSWNHWAFTKNALTGQMKIYHNGILWHSGGNHTKPINIDIFKLLSSATNNNYWHGKVKELRIFNKELDQNTINEWKSIRLQNTHPYYNTNLVAHYPLDEGGGNNINDLNLGSLATFNGPIKWGGKGEEISTFFNLTSFRPKISFFQGNIVNSLILDTIIDSFQIALPNIVTYRDIFTNTGSMANDSIVTIYVDTLGWEAISYIYTYDSAGVNISPITANIDSTINITELTYYTRYPMSFQIMSFVTPYGLGLNFGADGKTWYFDVTDFAPILKGNKRITMSGGGQWQEDMDIKFLFIVGTPTRDVIDIQQIWRPQYKDYTAIMADRVFEERNVQLNPTASAYKLRTTITGHRQNGEFNSQNHYLNIDGGTQEYVWPVWTECSENPVYPQGGTWIGDRAGWCPGQASDIREDDISSLVSTGQSVNIDYGLISSFGQSSYWVSSKLVSYGPINHTLDASVIDIISPSNKIVHFRKNPICSKPEVVIQNTGSNTLTSLKIEYWINNSITPEIFEWSGSLDFLEKENVILPAPSSLWSTLSSGNNNMFYVKISQPNNSVDEYSYNNEISSSFETAPNYPNNFVLRLQTNNGIFDSFNQISETSWEFLDNNGHVMYSSGNLSPNTMYYDTLLFENGCYTFKIIDTDDDGFNYWANNDGNGNVMFKNLGPGIIKTFDGDFGRSYYHQFIVGDGLSTEELYNFNIKTYPNPTKDRLIVTGDLKNASEIILRDNIGRIVSVTKVNSNMIIQKINVKDLSKGVYFLSVDDNKTIKKIVKQ